MVMQRASKVSTGESSQITGGAQKFGRAGLRVGAAAEGKNERLFPFQGAADGGTQLIRFNFAECRFAEALENFRNAQAGGFLDAIIQINEMPRELARQERADSSLAGAHESGKTNHLDAGLGPTQRRRLDHGFWKPRRGRLSCGASS